MTLRDSLLPILDRIARKKIDDLGFRPFTVAIRTRAWSGGASGSGTPTVTELVLTPRPKVLDLGKSTGKQSLIVGPITPAYTDAQGSGGYTIPQLYSPSLGSDYYYRVAGARGVEKYVATALDTTKSTGYFVALEFYERSGDYDLADF